MPPDIVWKNRPVRASLAQMESSLHQSVGRIVASNSLPPSRLDQSSLEVPPRKKRDKRDVLAPERLLGAFEAIDNRNHFEDVTVTFSDCLNRLHCGASLGGDVIQKDDLRPVFERAFNHRLRSVILRLVAYEKPTYWPFRPAPNAYRGTDRNGSHCQSAINRPLSSAIISNNKSAISPPPSGLRVVGFILK